MYLATPQPTLSMDTYYLLTIISPGGQSAQRADGDDVPGHAPAHAVTYCKEIYLYVVIRPLLTTSSSLVRNLHHQSGQQGELGCLLQIFTAPIQLCLQCCLRWPSGPPQAVMVWAPLQNVICCLVLLATGTKRRRDQLQF